MVDKPIFVPHLPNCSFYELNYLPGGHIEPVLGRWLDVPLVKSLEGQRLETRTPERAAMFNLRRDINEI